MVLSGAVRVHEGTVELGREEVDAVACARKLNGHGGAHRARPDNADHGSVV